MPRGFSKLLQLPEDPAAESPTNLYFSDENEEIFFTAKSAYKTPVAATTACRISESVYQVLVYLESRAVQRERNRRAALRDAGALPGGADEDPSHRRWKRRVYQLVRRRIGEYLATVGTAEHPSMPTGTTEEEVGLPKAERRDRTRTEKGLAYIERRRQAQRKKTRAKGKAKHAAKGSACSGGESEADLDEKPHWDSWREADLEEKHAAEGSACSGGASAAAWSSASASAWWSSSFAADWSSAPREQALKRLRTPSPTQRMRSTMQAGSSSSAAPVQEEHLDSEDTYETDYLHDEQEKRDADMERNLRMENSELPQSTPTNSELPQSTPTNQIEEEMEHMSKAYGDMASTPMQEEGRDEPVLPARDIMALDKEYITSYEQDHWEHAKRMTRSHKWDFERWLRSAKVARAPFVEVTETDVASHLAAMKFPMEELSPPEKMAPVPIEGGPGQWFRLDVRRQFMHTMRSWEAEHPEPQWTFAVHGTSMRAAKDILSGGWRESSNVTGGVHGLYCEGMHRRQCTIRYMTHAWEKSLPKWCVAAAMMELMVDRNDTKIVNSQWVQRNLGSVAIIAVLIHVVDLRKVYPAKFLGWVHVAGRTMKDMETEADEQCS